MTKILMTKDQIRVLGDSLKEYRVRNWNDKEEADIVCSLLSLLERSVELKEKTTKLRKTQNKKLLAELI